MKKRLEAELISIAHRVLKLKNKSEIDQLYHETQKLYEALAVLKFYGDNYEQLNSDVVIEDLEEKIATFVETKTPVETPIKEVEATIAAEPEAIEEPQVEEEPIVVAMEESTDEEELVVEEEIEEEPIALEEEESEEEPINVGEITLEEDEIEDEEEEPTALEEEETEEEPIIIGEITLEDEEIEDEEPIAELKSDLDFEPIFELAAESPIEDIIEEKVEEKKQEAQQISFEDLLGENYSEPVFVKPNDIVVPDSLKNVIDEKPLSLNDQHLKVINIGLNDKMAFVKNLFGDSNEDYNRVLSQLNTFSTFEEAKDFIDEIIKPDYNNWDGVDDYSERFIEIVAKKFS